MRYELMRHVRVLIEERGIALAWLEQTLDDPQWIEPDPGDPAVQRDSRAIPGFGGRTLRDAVDTTVGPERMVSLFFDRTRKGQP